MTCLCCFLSIQLAHASTCMQSGANDNGSTTYLPGVAAVAICAIADLSGGSLATLAR